jgi:hypothetical protein
VNALIREDLISGQQSWIVSFDPEETKKVWPEAPSAGAVFTPSTNGIYLYLWGCGLGSSVSGLGQFTNPPDEWEFAIDGVSIPKATLCKPRADEAATEAGVEADVMNPPE